MAAPGELSRLLVVGTGLVGTSVGLAAGAAGAHVQLSDTDPRAADLAAALGAGEVLREADPVADLAVVAVPPAAVAMAIADVVRRNLAVHVTHVASVQAKVQRDIETLLPSANRVVGGHPIAGRELSGPEHADADLFRDRPWVVCPAAGSDPETTAAVAALARMCGAQPVVLDARAHDELFARLSHVPQLVASALAASLSGLADDRVALAGSGIRDTTRLADSDPDLWAEIVAANAEAVAAGLRLVAEPLLALAERLEDGDDGATQARTLLRQGRAGRALLPGKHGRAATAWATVAVVVPDQPGALADLLVAVAGHEVNLEDLRVEHQPGQPLGVAELAVAPGARDRLLDALRRDGWSAHAGSDAAL